MLTLVAAFLLLNIIWYYACLFQSCNLIQIHSFFVREITRGILKRPYWYNPPSYHLSIGVLKVIVSIYMYFKLIIYMFFRRKRMIMFANPKKFRSSTQFTTVEMAYRPRWITNYKKEKIKYDKIAYPPLAYEPMTVLDDSLEPFFKKNDVILIQRDVKYTSPKNEYGRIITKYPPDMLFFIHTDYGYVVRAIKEDELGYLLVSPNQEYEPVKTWEIHMTVFGMIPYSIPELAPIVKSAEKY